MLYFARSIIFALSLLIFNSVSVANADEKLEANRSIAKEVAEKIRAERNTPRMTSLMCGIKNQTKVFAGGARSKELADQGKRDELLKTGYRYLNGVDLPRDIEAGRKYLQMAAKNGMTEAHYILGDSLLNEGLTDETSFVAEQHFQTALKAGCNEALVGLAKIAGWRGDHERENAHLEAARDGGSKIAELILVNANLPFDCDNPENVPDAIAEFAPLVLLENQSAGQEVRATASLLLINYIGGRAKQCDQKVESQAAVFLKTLTGIGAFQSAHGSQRKSVATANVLYGEMHRSFHKSMSFWSYRRAACLYLPIGMQKYAESLAAGFGTREDKAMAFKWFTFLSEDPYASEVERQSANQAMAEISRELVTASLPSTSEEIGLELLGHCGTESYPIPVLKRSPPVAPSTSVSE